MLWMFDVCVWVVDGGSPTKKKKKCKEKGWLVFLAAFPCFLVRCLLGRVLKDSINKMESVSSNYSKGKN